MYIIYTCAAVATGVSVVVRDAHLGGGPASSCSGIKQQRRKQSSLRTFPLSDEETLRAYMGNSLSIMVAQQRK